MDQEPVTKDQGPGTKGLGTRGLGAETRDQGPGTKDDKREMHYASIRDRRCTRNRSIRDRRCTRSRSTPRFHRRSSDFVRCAVEGLFEHNEWKLRLVLLQPIRQSADDKVVR